MVRHRATPAPPVVREKARTARPSPAHSQFAVEDEMIHNPAEVQSLIDRYLNTRGAPDHLDPDADNFPIEDFFPATSSRGNKYSKHDPEDPNMFPFHLNELKEDSRRGRQLRDEMKREMRKALKQRKAKALRERVKNFRTRTNPSKRRNNQILRRKQRRHSSEEETYQPSMKSLVNNRIQHSHNSYSYAQIRMS